MQTVHEFAKIIGYSALGGIALGVVLWMIGC